ncbi:MAG: hypothetical protein R2825_30455 [Saprospiraceae bacterium]
MMRRTMERPGQRNGGGNGQCPIIAAWRSRLVKRSCGAAVD